MRLSLVVAPFGVSRSFSSSFSEPPRALRTASICFWTCRDRSWIRSSVISSSLKMTSSRIVRSPVCSWSPSSITFLAIERRARDRLDDRELAALDAPRDLDLAFAREQRHRAHLAQVHADRVVGLVERARREVELELLGAFAVRSSVFSSRRYFWSESMTSMPALPNVLKRSSSSSDEVISEGSSSFTSSYSR